MNIKKEYIILVVIIIALSAYLLRYNADRTNYELPKLPELVKQNITKVVITEKNDKIELVKKDNKWRIMPESFLADQSKMDKIIDAIDKMTLTALVSESEIYDRYELGNDKKLGLSVYTGSTLKRKLDLGKAASSNRHTFVKIDGDKRVYHARGNFKSTFNQTVDDLRDKKVMTAEKDQINMFRLVQGGEKFSFQLKDEPAEEKEAEKGPETKTEMAWFDGNNVKQEKSKVDEFLTQVTNIKCERYLDHKKKEDLKNPLYTVKLTGPQEYTVNIYDKVSESATEYAGTTSQSEHPFMLPEWKVNSIKTKLEALTKKPEDKKE